MGDFNIDLLKTETKTNVSDFLEANMSWFFTPYITRPTRITPYSKTLIDNIFTNFLSYEANSYNLICSISDHIPQILKLNLKANKTQKTKKSWRDFSKFNREDFLLDFLSIPWNENFENKDANDKLKLFIDSTNNLIERHAPTKTKWVKNSTSLKPWVTKGLLQSIKNRDKIHKKLLKAKKPEDKLTKFNQYKSHRNLLLKLLRISKNKYFKDYLSTHKSNLSLVWKAIHQITNTKSKDNLSPKLLIQNKKQITKDTEIAEYFIKFYGSIAEITKSKIPETNKSFQDYLQHPNGNSIFIMPTSPVAIFKLIQNLDDRKASGPNSIPPKILKIISITASDILSNIFNECIEQGIYPDCLKKATIKPLHKKNSKLDVSNYRPISLLSNINKLFEKILHTRVVEFLEANNVIFTNQFGFRKGHNTSHAIIALTEIVRNALDNNEFAAAVFIDLQKAFDTVDHKILTQKLHHYGIRGKALDIFKSYLKDRSQCVLINETKSTYLEIKHGVPQGSVLGPLLFLIYINDLHRSISFSTAIHFADDTSLICRESSLKRLNRKINRDLALLVHWLRANKISLNASKTEIILFKTKRKPITKKLNFRLSGQKLMTSTHAIYLGLTLDENLTWENHLHGLILKLSRSTGILAKLRHYLDYKTLISVYHALFESHVKYCLLTLGHTTRELLDKIEKLQNKALRIMHFKNPRE